MNPHNETILRKFARDMVKELNAMHELDMVHYDIKPVSITSIIPCFRIGVWVLPPSKRRENPFGAQKNSSLGVYFDFYRQTTCMFLHQARILTYCSDLEISVHLAREKQEV